MSAIQSTIRVQLDEGAYPPTRAHATDAGLDLRAAEFKCVSPGAYAVVRTGTHVEIPPGWCGLVVSRSSLNGKHGITSTGLIDAGYTGEILVALHNSGNTSYIVQPGDKVSQLVLLPCATPQIEIVEKIAGGERGNDGFGSSGR